MRHKISFILFGAAAGVAMTLLVIQPRMISINMSANAAVEDAYKELNLFGAVFERGRNAAVAAAERIGGRILEVGIGTGISLPLYSSSCRLCGVDISAPMLRKAEERVAELNLTNVEGLWVMDAEHLSFPDNSFDVVVAQYEIGRAHV